MNLYSCSFKEKKHSPNQTLKRQNTVLSHSSVNPLQPHQQLFMPLAPYSGECRMSLASYAWGWTSQEASPLTCVGSFKTVPLIGNTEQHRAPRKWLSGCWVYRFPLPQLPDECNAVSEARVVKQSACQSQEVQASPEVPVVAAELHGSQKMEGK